MPTKRKTQPKTKAVTKTKEEVVVKEKVQKKDVLIPVLVGAIIIASFAVGFLYGKVSVYEKLDLKQGAAAAQPKQEAAPVVSKDQVDDLFADSSALVFGNSKSKVLFIEFSDPSCPYCHIAAGKNPELNKQVDSRFVLTEDGGTYKAPVLEMKKLVDEGKAAFAWVYSPGHGAGELATQALYCAKDQNKFWEVHDLLMSSKGYDLLNETVKDDVAKAGELVDFVRGVVNPTQLQTCFEEGTYSKRIQSDTALSRAFGVQGTPSFFVNERNFPGAYSYTDMESVVEELLK